LERTIVMSHCRIIIIRGAPGVGKSTLVKQLRRQLNDAFVIDIDDLWRMWAPPKWGCREQETRVLLLVRDLVAVMRERVRYILILGCLSHRDLRLLPDTHVSLISIYLRGRELRRRLSQRGGDWAEEESIRIAIRVNAEIRRSRLRGKRIDLTELSFIEAAKAIIDACQDACQEDVRPPEDHVISNEVLPSTIENQRADRRP
jgi:broad-specificity NMP kinase